MDRTARFPRRPPALSLLATLALLPGHAAGQAATEDDHVVVLDVRVTEDFVNLTVASYTQPGLIESAALYADDAVVSNATGGVYLSYGTTGTLSFRRLGAEDEVELRLAYQFYHRGNYTVQRQAIPLALPGAPDVRPVDAWLDAAGNVTVVLRNFGASGGRDILVALQDEDGAGVGTPYFRAIPRLASGAEAAVEFSLLTATDQPVVAVEVGGATRTHTVVLRSGTGATAAAPRSVELTTEFPSLEAAPGGSAAYTLTLRNRGGERLLALGVTGLPEAYTSAFTIGGSRVQNVQLAAGATRTVQLSIGVPSSGDAGAGGPRTFEAWVGTAEGNDTTELAAVPLTLSVTGAERLELSGRNWFATAAPGAVVEAVVEVRNRGTAPAHEVELAATAPSGWDATFEPARIARLGPGETAEVTLRISAPLATADGRYVVDVNAASALGEARERSFTVEMARPSESQLPWLAAAGVAGLGGVGLVVFLRRR